MNPELLKKYFNNQCTDQELESVVNWMNEAGRTSEGKSILYGLWEEMDDDSDIPGVGFEVLLDRIHHHINIGQTTDKLEVAGQNLEKYGKRIHLLNVLTKIAAVLLLPVIGITFAISAKYYSVKSGQASVNMAYNEVFSSVDAITKITLPDGSNVWLNHSSSLKYPATFQGKSRKVELKGEGYFEVSHNAKIPFIVSTGDLEVVATGTTFNILAYPDEDRIETSLINGIVSLERSGSDGKLTDLLKMKPSELSIYKKSTNQIITRTISDDRYFSWKEGKLIFNKEPMGEVVKKLRRWFNVDLQINDPRLLELNFTGTFQNETLPQVMELLALISPVNYSISGRKETGNGTFTKRKVILSYRNRPVGMK